MRWRRWIIGLVVLAAGLGVAGRAILKLQSAHPLDYPDDVDVVGVTAELFASDQGDAVPPFAVPSEYIPRLLAAFRPVEEYTGRRPPLDTPIGRLVIRATDGRALEILVPWVWKEPLFFRVGGVWYVR